MDWILLSIIMEAIGKMSLDEGGYVEFHTGFFEFESKPWRSLRVHFRRKMDMIDFSRLVGQKISRSTEYIWYPVQKIDLKKNRKIV